MIASVVAIVALIVGVTVPLFRPPRATLVCDAPPAQDPFQRRHFVLRDRSWHRRKQCHGVLVDQERPTRRGRSALGRSARAAAAHAAGQRPARPAFGKWNRWAGEDILCCGPMVRCPWSRSPPGSPAHKPPRLLGARSTRWRVTPAVKGPPPRAAVLRRSEAGATTRVALLPDGTISILRQVAAENLAGDDGSAQLSKRACTKTSPPTSASSAMDREGNTLYAGTKDGVLARWQLKENGEVGQREVARAFPDRRAITALALVLGDVSLAVGDAQGGLSTWFPVKAEAARRLRLAHQLRPHASAVRQILPSGRNKSLAQPGRRGHAALGLRHQRAQPAFAARPSRAVPGAAWPWGRGATACWHWTLPAHSAFGESTADARKSASTRSSAKSSTKATMRRTMCGRRRAGKISSRSSAWCRCMFGTLKGTFYAMLFAVPISLFGAAYASNFTTPALRQTIKPVVEIMASVPSVVIGFLIALWLAPIIERWIFAFFLSLVTVPATFVAFLCLWQLLRRMAWTKRVENGYEFLVLVPVLLAGAALAVCLAGPLEARLFGGNFRQWLFQGPLGMRYDQRNNIIIAFGLGFTVIPIIFSIAEDSLSNVPYSMAAASMALGASRWQTFWRVVLPSASPGIFAAVMIGFGRAVGETMIVLMATGNTPILDWSPLNGMRTLSANIAVEIPEAPVGGTLYRVLFLCAVLLFLLTFTVNTAAELVRQHLRKRFGQF